MQPQFHYAPVQGHTDAPYRHFLNLHYPVEARHYTPFIRAEHGAARERDIRDLTSRLNDGIDLTAQVIFRNIEELDILLRDISQTGASKIDLNCGCPFPLQTAKGRGAAMVANSAVLSEVADVLTKYPAIEFSMKMRLGYRDRNEWKDTVAIINSLPLTHIAMHPRVARQQYGGAPDMDAFSEFIDSCSHPVIYNGDIHAPSDISEIINRFPKVAGVMCGRGVLARPSLFTEYLTGEEWSREKRIERMLAFHRDLLRHYSETLCGEHQILSKIKPFWEYSEDAIGRKPWKAINKANSMAKYHTALALIDL